MDPVLNQTNEPVEAPVDDDIRGGAQAPDSPEAPEGVELGPGGFPLNTKPEDMEPVHQAAYYRDLAVKAAKSLKALRAEKEAWEADKKRASMSADEAAQDKLREELREQVRAEEAAKSATQLVGALALVQGLTDEDAELFLEQLNIKAVLDENGDVDALKLNRLLGKWKGSAGEKKLPVYTSHQGNRGPTVKPSGLDAGRAEYDRLHGKSK